MSIQDLVEQKAKIEEELRVAKEELATEYESVKEAFSAFAEKYGVDPRTLAKKMFPPLAKYRNPDNHDETWCGQGAKPKWIRGHLEGGGNLEDLAIGNGNSSGKKKSKSKTSVLDKA